MKFLLDNILIIKKMVDAQPKTAKVSKKKKPRFIKRLTDQRIRRILLAINKFLMYMKQLIDECIVKVFFLFFQSIFFLLGKNLKKKEIHNFTFDNSKKSKMSMNAQ